MMGVLPREDLAPAMLAAVAHELRQPVAAASLAAELTPPNLALVRSALARASGSCDLLAWLARSLRGDMDAALELQPRKLAQAFAAILRPAEDLRVEVPGKREVLAGPFALETVLHNLVRNARQHAPGATVTIRARIVQNRPKHWPQMRLQGRALLLTVSDSGPGIPLRFKPLLFSPLVRAGGQGLGIGLWLCQTVCQQHGGDLWLDETSPGASFCSLWPLAPRRGGMAALSGEQRAAICRKGGQRAHEQGRAHEFTPEEARAAGRKGGQSVSQNRAHMATIGRRGALNRAKQRATALRSLPGEPPAKTTSEGTAGLQEQHLPGQALERREGTS